MREDIRRSWAEIDIRQLQKNYEIYKLQLPKSKRIMAVVKADAYGHGDYQIAKALYEIGVRDFAVSNIQEAYALRKKGLSGEIMILGYTPPEYARELYEMNIIQAVLSEEYAEALMKERFNVRCNIALDTGMNRIGLSTKNIEKCSGIIRKYCSILNVNGLFTHLCVADTDNYESQNFTKKQIGVYESVLESISDLGLNYNHCLNSAGGLWHESKYTSIVRLGIIMYGLRPDYSNVLPVGIKPILQWKSVVSMVKWVEEGDTIGYGRGFMAHKRMKIATVSTGYADGYMRLMSNVGYTLINGKKAKIVGKICMDQFMVDVTEIQDVALGTEVVLLGKSEKETYYADDMAKNIGTIGYEVVCNIGKRVPRLYRE